MGLLCVLYYHLNRAAQEKGKERERANKIVTGGYFSVSFTLSRFDDDGHNDDCDDDRTANLRIECQREEYIVHCKREQPLNTNIPSTRQHRTRTP